MLSTEARPHAERDSCSPFLSCNTITALKSHWKALNEVEKKDGNCVKLVFQKSQTYF